MKASKKNMFLLGWFLLLILAGLQACSSDPPVVVSKGSIITTGPTYTPSPTFTPCSSILGDSTIEASAAVNSGYVAANRYYFSGTTIKSFSLYAAGAGQFSMAIYSDNASVTAPANLLGQSSAVSTVAAAGWYTTSITPLTLSAGYYWLAMQTTGTVTTHYNLNNTTMPYINQAFGPFPNTYSGYVTCSCSLISMYATYCP